MNRKENEEQAPEVEEDTNLGFENTAINPAIDPDYQEVEVANPEMEERLKEWTMQGNVENISPFAILYRFINKATSGKMEQMNKFEGEIPSRHEIGLMYGAGSYYLILTRPAGKKQPRRNTSYSFTLSDTYNDLKRLEDQKKVPAMYPQPVYQGPVRGNREEGGSLKEAFAMVQAMMAQMFGIMQPILTNALSPRPVVQSGNPALPDLSMYKTINELLKAQTKENIGFYNDVAKGVINMGPQETDDETKPEEEKPDMLDKILKVIEPFIPLLSQNNLAAKTAAAGFRAVPAVRQVIKDVTDKPDVARGIVKYVVEKEGPEGAKNVLKNMGINPDNYGISMVMVPDKSKKGPQKKAGKK